MIEAAALIALGAMLAKVGLMPLQEALARRQERLDAIRAAEIVAEIRRREEAET